MFGAFAFSPRCDQMSTFFLVPKTWFVCFFFGPAKTIGGQLMALVFSLDFSFTNHMSDGIETAN